jgi:hypothetical protein
MLKTRKKMTNVNYIKPVVQLIEVEMENSFLATSEVRFGAGVPGAASSGKWSSSPSLGNNAVPRARADGKWSN